MKITDFGAFVEIFRTQGTSSHFNMLIPRVNKVTDVLKEGEMVKVKLIAIEGGNYRFQEKH